MKDRRSLCRTLLFVFALTISFFAGKLSETQNFLVFRPSPEARVENTTDLELITEAYSIIRSNYINFDELDNLQLAHGAIRGMVEALGDTGHSRFLTPEMAAKKQQMLGGEKGPNQGGEASQETETVGPSSGDNVSWEMVEDTNVAYICIRLFKTGTTESLQQVLSEVKEQGGERIVLDLRDNPGGLVREAVGVTSQFLSEGVVVRERNLKGEVSSREVQPGGLATHMPLVVLINHKTISSAEIVAAALQEAGRAVLVGERTFGTGTVLKDFYLADRSALMLGYKAWLTPSGKTIWHEGLSPDIPVQGRAAQLENAVELLRE